MFIKVEIKVNEVIEFNGETLQAVETENMSCDGCYFNHYKNCDMHCLPSERIDKKNVIFIKAQNAFINGAKWADRNTILSWISVEDSLPRQDEEVIVLCDKSNVSPMYEIAFAHIVNKGLCKDFNGWNIPDVKYWFPVPVLQKQH